MQRQLQQVREQAETEIHSAASLDALEQIRVNYLGRKGELTKLLREMGKLPAEDRPVIGQLANQVRQALETLWEQRQQQLKQLSKEASLQEEAIDVSLPGMELLQGHYHPVSLVLEELQGIFLRMGFAVEEGPEIELDYYNFEALNIPRDHPARAMQDSFYISEDVLLRTHTSPVQVRVMQRMVPQIPIRIIAPGKVYRRDDDATHSPMFHQVEGLVVDHGIRFSDLKGILLTFARLMFGAERQIRLRPSYFPFTEPSAEVDISCMICGGSGCQVCSHSGWLEVLGSGMVHPRVLEHSGYDPDVVSGFAFGMGIERIAMLKYGIDDLRLLFSNDLRFLRQF